MVGWLGYGCMAGCMVKWLDGWMIGWMVGWLDVMAFNEMIIGCKVAYGIKMYNNRYLGDTFSERVLATKKFLLTMNYAPCTIIRSS